MEVKASQFRYPSLVRTDWVQMEDEQYVWSQPERRSYRRGVKAGPQAPKGASPLICLGFFPLYG